MQEQVQESEEERDPLEEPLHNFPFQQAGVFSVVRGGLAPWRPCRRHVSRGCLGFPERRVRW